MDPSSLPRSPPEARLLIAEDSRTQATRLRLVLEDAGYRVDVADDGAVAQELLARGGYDLLISDVQMPAISGFDLCRHVKAAVATRDMPVIMLTALRDPVDIVNGLSAGADNFITKPFVESDLLRRVELLLASRRAATSGELRLATEVHFGGRRFTITAEKQQIVNLLVSTFEEMVARNLELEQSRAALRAANQRIEAYARRMAESADGVYRSLLERASDGILVVDSEGRVTECNSRSLEIVGRRESRVVGHRLDDFANPDADADRSAESSDDTGGPAPHSQPVNVRELSVRRDDGVLVRVEATSGELRESEAGGIVVIRDVTDRHRQTTRLREIIDAVADSIVIVDGVFRITLANRQARRLLVARGARRGLLGRSLLELVRMPDGEPLADTQQLLERNRHKLVLPEDGAPRYVEINAGPLMLDDAPCTIISLRDITDRLRIEEQVRQAQKLEAIGRLAGGVAHDFNNLLTVINSHADRILAGSPPDATVHQSALEIRHAGDSAAAMTRQLLSVGRRDVAQPTTTDLNTVVNGVSGILRKLAGERVDVQLSVSPQPMAVRIDPSQFEQVLLNLVVNARDAMPDGGSIAIETTPIDINDEYAAANMRLATGPYVRLSVSDTGTGMDADTLARLFEPFFTTKPVGVGTGLGLATVHSIITQSGGDIHVYSEPGNGSVFRVFLPRVEADASPEAAAPDTQPASETTVLVVDDADAVREVTVMLLEDAGYQVMQAADGQAALELMAAHNGRLDLVISDVVMPRMGGRELLARLRIERPDLPVLFCSGFTEHGARHNGVEPGERVNYLHKPFTAAQLRTAVRDAIAGKQPG